MENIDFRTFRKIDIRNIVSDVLNIEYEVGRPLTNVNKLRKVLEVIVGHVLMMFEKRCVCFTLSMSFFVAKKRQLKHHRNEL